MAVVESTHIDEQGSDLRQTTAHLGLATYRDVCGWNFDGFYTYFGMFI